jgi:antitoxin MazE
MRTAVSKWGNSLALRLPKPLAELARLREGTSVEISIDDGALVIKPSRPRYELAKLLAGEDKKRRHDEVDWGPPKGEEIW